MENVLQRSFLDSRNVLGYSIRMVISIACSLGLCAVFANNSNTETSYVMCVITFAVATVIMAWLFFGKSTELKIIISAYFVKIVIGLVHYLIFFDSNYFSSNGQTIMYENPEFAHVFSAICSIADDKAIYGLWHTDLMAVLATHPEMMHLLSFPFVFFGNNLLTIAPFNAFCSSITCVSFVIMAQEYLSLSKEKSRYLLYLIAYFPMFIISSYLARDVAGIAVMSIGATMFFLEQELVEQGIGSYLCCLFDIYA